MMNNLDKKEFVDYDVHGLIGIRLVHSTKQDEAAVTKQIGFSPTKLFREPDITIRYTNSIPTYNLHLLGLNHSGYSDDGFYLLENGRRKGKARIPFEQIGKQCESVCENNLGPIPLLIAILNLTLLSKGNISLHASAFTYNQVGILVTGWAKGGKTEALFSFLNNGAKYLGDEWIVLNSNGEMMYGIPEPIRLWDWHLKYIPEVSNGLKLEERLVFNGIRSLAKLNDSISRGKFKKFLPAKLLRKAMPALKRQLNVTVLPSEIFGVDSCEVAKPEKVFLLVNHNGDDYEASPIEPHEIAQRMVASIQFEQLPFMEYYSAFKFAFPEKRNSFIENAQSYQYEFLVRALDGKEAYKIIHPYPLSFPKLYEIMRPFCDRKTSITRQSQTTIATINA